MCNNKNNIRPDYGILYGPTAVGKTELADLLSSLLPIEIINADVGQFYTPLTIGTAKPDWKEHKVPHHLFDVLDKPVNYSAFLYVQKVKSLIEDIRSRGAFPLIVGGSGFYIRSLFFNLPTLEGMQTTTETNNNSEMNTQQLWEYLNSFDAVRAQEIMKNDRYRIERALAIVKNSGTFPSHHKPLYSPFANGMLILLERSKEDLHKRIEKRLSSMINAGWQQEADLLRGTEWEQFLVQKKIIGYSEMLRIDDSTDFQQLITSICQRTKQYAKRQMTFLRMLERMIEQEKQNILEYSTNVLRCNLSVGGAIECLQIIEKQLKLDQKD